MKSKRTKRFTVRLWAELPASAVMEVEAETEEDAKEWALENYRQFHWDGADYERPDGSQVVEAEIVK